MAKPSGHGVRVYSVEIPTRSRKWELDSWRFGIEASQGLRSAIGSMNRKHRSRLRHRLEKPRMDNLRSTAYNVRSFSPF